MCIDCFNSLPFCMNLCENFYLDVSNNKYKLISLVNLSHGVVDFCGVEGEIVHFFWKYLSCYQVSKVSSREQNCRSLNSIQTIFS